MMGEVGLVPGPPVAFALLLRVPYAFNGVMGGGVPSLESEEVEPERARW